MNISTGIPYIDLEHLQNAELIGMMSNIQKLIEKSGAEALGVSVFFENFSALLVEARAAMKVVRGSAFAKAMDAGDLRRSNNYRVFYYYIKAFTFSDDVLIKEAATQIMRIIRDSGNPLRSGLIKRTVLLENLCAKLQPDRYSGFLDTLQARKLLDAVAAANHRYKELYAKRGKERSDKGSGNVGDVRKKIYPVYHSIVTTVNLLAQQYPDSTIYQKFVAQATEEVKRRK